MKFFSAFYGDGKKLFDLGLSFRESRGGARIKIITVMIREKLAINMGEIGL